ncbi:NlpC/P60 family protein [Treponema sp. TIM-1]|uniref:C40 family peptidase n=1 Tax=Treponema sp. TIM-1 TaxID=2898417 RepID=UPI00397EDFA7
MKMGFKFLGSGIVFFFLVMIFSGRGLFAAIPITTGSASPQEVRSQVIAAAEQYQGTPYRYGGTDRQGLDCSGLVYRSFRDALGIDVPRTTAELHAWAEPIQEANLMPGDLVFFNTTGPLSHVGLYAGKGKFIHAASSGQQTGVIYSELSARYWKNTFAGAGRILPSGDPVNRVHPTANPVHPAAKPEPLPARGQTAEVEPGPFHLGFGLAPSWNSLLENNPSFRGAVMQAGLFYDLPLRLLPIRIGLELRPQWDTALHVFRMPIAISAGFKELVRIFAGPAFAIGSPVLNTGDENRPYTGGNSWLGEIGIAVAPLSFKLPRGALSVYGEIAWQSYVKDPALEADWKADVGTALRVSTGLQYLLNW